MKNLLIIITLLFVALPTVQATSPTKIQATNYGSWSYECAKKPCFISQLLMVTAGEEAHIAGGLSLLNLPKKQTLLSVRVSALADQSQGLGIKIDGHKDIRVAIEACSQSHCEVNVLADNTLISEMKSGKILGVFYINKKSQKQVSLPFSLHGFPEAFLRLKNELN